MSQTLPDLFGTSNQSPDQRVGNGDRSVGADDRLGWQERIRRALRSIYPLKTAHHLAIVGDVTTRQAERIMAREQGISGDVLVGLLRSDNGFRFLRQVMEGSRAAWWQEVGHEREISFIKQQRRALDKQLKRLEDDA